MTSRNLLFASIMALSLCARDADAVPNATVPQAGQSLQPVPTLGAPAAPVFDEDPPPRLSLPTESDRALWRKPGLRFGLGLVYGRFYGIGGPPNARLMGPTIRVGLRLDEEWSLMGSLQYLGASGAMTGLRFAGTVEPTWHATQHLSFAAGIGFGGIVETTGARPNPDPQTSTLTSSYTFPNASQLLPSCDGVGLSGLLRAEWMIVMGPRSSTGLAFEVDGQWTACVNNAGRVEPDTARPIVRRQWWPHLGGSLILGVMWR